MIFYLIVTPGVSLFILIDAVRGTNKLKAITLKPFNKWYIYLMIFLLSNVATLSLLRWTVRKNIARPEKMPSRSMVPTLLVGDHLVADMRIYKNEKTSKRKILQIIFEFGNIPQRSLLKELLL